MIHFNGHGSHQILWFADQVRDRLFLTLLPCRGHICLASSHVAARRVPGLVTAMIPTGYDLRSRRSRLRAADGDMVKSGVRKNACGFLPLTDGLLPRITEDVEARKHPSAARPVPGDTGPGGAHRCLPMSTARVDPDRLNRRRRPRQRVTTGPERPIAMRGRKVRPLAAERRGFPTTGIPVVFFEK